MYDQETTNQETSGPEAVYQETTKQEAADKETTPQETAKEAPLAEEQGAKEPEEAPEAPEPSAIGDENIAILKHDIYRKGGEDDSTLAMGVEFIAENVSDKVIGSVLFEAVFYDMEGNTLDTIELKKAEWKPGNSRTIRINYSGSESDKVKSYCVRVIRTTMPPESKATGNEKVVILKHSLPQVIDDDQDDPSSTGVEFAIRNVSDTTIASVVFEAVVYDIEGNILDTVKHKEIDLKPNTSRAVAMNFSQQGVYQIRGYDVKITRMRTADDEKVQLRWQEMKTTDDGQEEVGGTVKNISGVKTDAALIATFFDPKKENIGTRVILLRDIEPGSIKQFHFLFKPIEEDMVRSHTLNIGEIVE